MTHDLNKAKTSKLFIDFPVAEEDVAECLKALMSQLLPLKGRSWVRTQSKLVLRTILAIWARVSKGMYNTSRISIPRVMTNRKTSRIKYGHPTKSLVDGGKTRRSIKLRACQTSDRN